MRALLLCLLAACADDPIDYGDDVLDPQNPPRGEGDIEPWIAAGHYTTWSCEPASHEKAENSPHPRNRICSNDVLSAAVAGSGELPLGAASVKELLDESDVLIGYAVSRKIDGSGKDGWYWYEKHSKRVFADGMGAGSCPLCHEAARDYTFVIVP